MNDVMNVDTSLAVARSSNRKTGQTDGESGHASF